MHPLFFSGIEDDGATVAIKKNIFRKFVFRKIVRVGVSACEYFGKYMSM